MPRPPVTSVDVPLNHSPSNVHPSARRGTSGRIEKIVHEVIRRRPDHLLTCPLKIDSGSAHREGWFGAGVSEREGWGCRRRDDVESLWRIDDLDPEYLIELGSPTRLDQELHRIDVCRKGSILICAPGNTTPERESEYTFARNTPDLVPLQGGNKIQGRVGRERRTANVGGDGIGYDLVAPRVL